MRAVCRLVFDRIDQAASGRGTGALADTAGQCSAAQCAQCADRWDWGGAGAGRRHLSLGLPGAPGRYAVYGRPADLDAGADRDDSGDTGRAAAGAPARHLPWYSRVRVLVLGSYALTGLVPFFFPPEVAIIAIIAIWAIATVPQTIVNVAFTMVMGAVAGPNQRYYLMSRRWSIMGVTTAITVALVGVILDMISFPLNYQLVFIASFAGGMLSFAFSSRIELPDKHAARSRAATGASRLRERLRDGLAAMRENADLQPFSDQPVRVPLRPDAVDPAVPALLGARAERAGLMDRRDQHRQQRRADGGLLSVVEGLASGAATAWCCAPAPSAWCSTRC